MLRRTVALAAMLPLTGCYTYIPAELSAVPPGQEVRVYLSRRALAELPEDVPATDLYVRGALTAQQADSLTIRVPVTERVVGVIQPEIRQEVRIPTTEVVGVQRREFSTPRTALAIGGAAIGTAVIIGLIFEAVGVGDNGEDPGPDLARVPLFTIPLR